MQPLNSDRSSISVIAFILGMLGVALLGDILVQAQTVILPGESIVLNSADAPPECSGQDSGVPVTRLCQTNERHLDVVVVSGASLDQGLGEPQTGSALATLINQILIPESTNASQVLAVDIATEVAWRGALIVGGLNNTFAQVIATLQVRNTTTGQVAASDTFLFERADASLSLDVLDIVDGVKITNSTGTNITAFLERGQTYAIEVEAKCDIAVPTLGGSACTFFDDVASVINSIPFSSAFVGDGFDVGPITVTVASDPVEGLLGN